MDIDFTPDTQDDGTPAAASVFANTADLANYARTGSLATGDNGVGAWGDDTTSTTIPQVALPRDTISDADHGRPVKIVGASGRPFIAYVTDKMPATRHITNGAGIDLNPAAAALAGHPGDGLAPVKWKFADPSDVVNTPVAFQPDGSGPASVAQQPIAFQPDNSLQVVDSIPAGARNVTPGMFDDLIPQARVQGGANQSGNPFVVPPPPADPDAEAQAAQNTLADTFTPQGKAYLDSLVAPSPALTEPPPATVGHQVANAVQEVRGGAADGTLGMVEGFNRFKSQIPVVSPESITTGINQQITAAQTELDKIKTLPADVQDSPDIHKKQADLLLQLAHLHDALTNHNQPEWSSFGDAMLSPEGQALQRQDVDDATATANAARDAKTDAGTMFGQDPTLKDTTLARVARAGGEVVPLVGAGMVPGVGTAAAAGAAGLQAKASAYDEYYNEAIQRGEGDEQAKQEAQDYSDAAALRTVPEMAAFLGSGKLAAGVVSKLLSPSAPAAVRALASGAAAYASNAATGTVNQLVEQAATGKPLDPSYSLERGVQDTLFSVHPGAEAYSESTARAAELKARMLQDRDAASNPAPVADPSRPPSAPPSNPTDAAPSPTGATAPPVFAQGDTPEQRANAFLDGDGTAARFAPDEPVPASLNGLPTHSAPDGARIVFDPEDHVPDDFSDLKLENPAPTIRQQVESEAEDRHFFSDEHKQAWIDYQVADRELQDFQAKRRDAGSPITDESRAQTKVWRDQKSDAVDRGAVKPAPLKTEPLSQTVTQSAPDAETKGISDVTGAKWDGDTNEFGTRGIKLANGNIAWVDEARLHPSQVEALDKNSSEVAPTNQPRFETGGGESDPEGIAHDEDEEPPAPTAAEIQRDRDLEAGHRAEQEREARAGIGGAGGVELLEAVRAAGGLPTADPAFRGELRELRENCASAPLAGHVGTFNLFRHNAPTLDDLTSRLREQGFDVETPSDTLDLLNRRLTTKRPEYGFAARAEAQSGMASSEAYFRRTPPRTPEELRPLQQRWTRALRTVAPETALRLEVIKQDALDSMMRGQTVEHGSPHAAYLDGAIYLSEKALRDNTSQVNRVNFLHEIVHHFERALPESELARLRDQHSAEMVSGKSPLHDSVGNLRRDVDPRVKDNFSEWLAERVAWDNEHHFSGEINPAAEKTATGRLAARVRQFVGRVWKTFRPEMPTDDVNARFREWMGRGARANESTGEAQFARRRSGEESSSEDARPDTDPDREDAPGSLEAAAAHVGGSDAFRRRSGTDYWPTAADHHAETSALAQWAEPEGKLIRREGPAPVPTKEGGEHLVHFDPATQRWVKETYPGSFGGAPRFDRDANGKPTIALDQATPGEYLRRLRDNKVLFGDDVKLEGIRPSPDGTSVITSQADAGGALPNEPAIVKTLAEHDFVPVPGVPEQRGLTPMFYRAWDRKVITDATRDNFRVVDGQPVPIDVGISEAGPKLHDHLSGLIAKDAGTPPPEAPKFAFRQTLKGARQSLESREQKDNIAAGKDAAETRASIIARQAANSVRLDFPDPKDREAMPFVVEAAGIKSALQHDLQRVRNGSDAKLVKKYVPVVQHAIDNFDRLNALKGNYEAITDKQRLIERRHGINTPQVKNYVTRLLEMPEHLKDFEPVLLGSGGSGGGGSRYFVKGRDFATLAEAIEAGYGPKSTDIADLLERRIGTGQKLVQERRLWSQLRATTAPGDALNRPIIGQMEEHTLPGGRKEMRLPLGYESVTANGEPLVVHRQYAGLFKALYGDSKLRQRTLGRLLLNLTGIAKHGTLVFDTFHVGRVLSKELFGGYQTGYNKGLSLLEYNDRDLSRAVAAGDVSQSQADYARRQRPMADELIKAGLNVGRVADNLNTNAVKHLPVIGGFNQWVFGKLSRGAMLQTALTNYARNLSRFPELGRDGAARRTAKEMNEVFGNLGSQGIFQSKTMQDLARTVFLAPQWAESQVRAELRGAGQLARIPFDAARGKLRVGTVAQGMASGVIAMLAANQVINQMSRGQFTWQNKEDDRKLDAWIPGGKRGFWFDPFSIAAESLHHIHELYARYNNPITVGTKFLSSKFSPVMRGVSDLWTGRDYAERPFLSQTDRIRAALLDAAPFPMPLNAFVQKDPRQTLGVRWSRQSGSLEKQVLQSLGMKVQAEASPTQKMFALAQPYRPDRSGAMQAGDYTELRRALADDNTDAAQDEIRLLVQSQGKKLSAIQEAVGNAKPEKYAGPNKADNAAMLKSLTPVQMEVYQQAQLEHRLNAAKFQRIMAGMRTELLK